MPASIPTRTAEYELHTDRTGCARGHIAAPADLESPRMAGVGTVGYKEWVVRMPQNHQVMENKETAELSQMRGLNAMWDPGPEKGQPWKTGKACS